MKKTLCYLIVLLMLITSTESVFATEDSGLEDLMTDENQLDNYVDEDFMSDVEVITLNSVGNNLDEVVTDGEEYLHTRSSFPDIADRGEINSDQAFASVYYQFTYETNENPETSSLNINSSPYCPQYPYSMGHSFTDGACTFEHCYTVINQLGCLRYSDYSNDIIASDYWFSDYYSDNTEAKINALHVRGTKHTYEIPTKRAVTIGPIHGVQTLDQIIEFEEDSEDTLHDLKALLENHKVITTLTNYDWRIVQDASGNDCIICANGNSTRAITIVGYNDEYEVDVNNNNTIENWEKGAFIAATSDGVDSYNNGYVWLLYDSFNRISCSNDSTINDNTRKPLIHEIDYIMHTDDTNYNLAHYLFYTLDVEYKNVYFIGSINISNSYPTEIDFNYSLMSLDGGPGGELMHFPHTCIKPSVLLNEHNSFSGSIIFDLSSSFVSIDDYFPSFYNRNYYMFRLRKFSDCNVNINSITVIDENQNVILNLTDGMTDDDLVLYSRPYKVINGEIELINGDIDYSGVVDEDDIDYLSDYLLGTTDISNIQFLLADVNGDGEVTLRDIRLIRKIIMGEL